MQGFSASPLTLTKDVVIRPRCKVTASFSFPPEKPYMKLLTPPRIAEELKNICKRALSKIFIVSPYVTKDALTYILSEAGDVDINVIVGTRSSYLEVEKTSTLFDKRVSVKLRGRVHCKIVLTDNEVSIGSSNITMSGLNRSHEISIATNDLSIVNDVHSFCNMLWEGSEYREQYYSDLNAIDASRVGVFVTSVKNLPPLVLELARHAEENIIMTTPTYTSDAIEVLLNNIKPSVHIEAFVKLDERDWAERAVSDPWAIRLLLDRGATVWDAPLLHAKVFIVDHKIALISSLNFTNQAFKYIFDAGILTRNRDLIESIMQYIGMLRSRRIDPEHFEGILASFNTRLPFILVGLMQKEGDHFSDEEDPSHSRGMEDVEVVPQPYPEHAGTKLALPQLPKPLRKIRSKTSKTKPADAPIPSEGVVLIGRKPLVNYFKACTFLFLKENRKFVTIKARGRLISKAVDLAQIFRYSTFKLEGVKIGSSRLLGSNGKMRYVSFIEITISKS